MLKYDPGTPTTAEPVKMPARERFTYIDPVWSDAS
jgi:hypothetical protein